MRKDICESVAQLVFHLQCTHLSAYNFNEKVKTVTRMIVLRIGNCNMMELHRSISSSQIQECSRVAVSRLVFTKRKEWNATSI